ncbi:Tc5 transposase DNA-binding domain [Popillia japonica]|uniref:Tc5 transposase DNA-binding domain n=1 Tax=Popillia japonica TaxID=7064 RepID=A0AAW1KLI9_POPJA
MTTIKRKALSLQDKIKILQAYDEKSPTTNQTELAAELQLPVSTLRTILKNREEIKEKDRLRGLERKKQRVGKLIKYVEKVLVKKAKSRKVDKVCRESLSGMASSSTSFKTIKYVEKVLVEWLHQARALKLPRSGPILCEKARKIAESFRENQRQCPKKMLMRGRQWEDAWMGRLPELLQNYEPRNIFNADEFGLFFKLMPDKSYVFKGETCHGGKIRFIF